MKNIEDIYPCSPLQKGLLFHALAAPDSGVYVNHFSCALAGKLDATAFRQTWSQVIERHPVLRTAFLWEGLEEPMQVVRRQVKLPWHEEDWRQVPAAELEARFAAFVDAERRRGFSLGGPLLTRFSLLRTGAAAYRFVWTFHHLLLDGWSTSLVFEEVFAIYADLAAGRAVQRRRPRAFRDYIGWLKKQDLSLAEAYWRQTLAGFDTPTPLPPTRPLAQRQQERRFAERRLALDVELAAALEARSRRARVTLSTLVQGLWALLLGRYTGATDVVYGAVVSGRPPELDDVERIVGLFINTLPVRVRIAPRLPLGDWLEELQAQHLELRRFEHTPLASIRRWSTLPEGTPLFENIFAFENYPVDEGPSDAPADGDLHIRSVRTAETPHYPLTVVAWRAHTLNVRLTYAEDHFDEVGIDRLLSQLHALLQAATDHSRRLCDLPLMTPAERQQLLATWQAGHRRPTPRGSLYACFAALAHRTPDALAVVFGDARISYGALAARSERLARRLRARGIGPECIVALYFEPTVEMVIAILAVLAAGGAYLPLDPAYPAARLAFMLTDSGAGLLLSSRRLRHGLPAAEIPSLMVEEEETPATAVRLPVVAGDHPAYVIYTSGSTGRPKGVVVTHHNALRLFAATEDDFGFGADDVWTLYHSFAFDFSVWELWGALLYGGTLVVVPTACRRSPEAFHRLLVAARVTFLNQTPSAFAQLDRVDANSGRKSLALRWVVFGGEALELQRLAGWFARHGDRKPRLVNMYGITETTVHVTYRPLARADLGVSSKIGGPLRDLRLYLLDPLLEPVPPGLPGELHVGGEGLARGYLGRPGLTAARFVPDPFASTPGQRLYRAGDLGRDPGDQAGSRRDFVYLGRADHQVKVRGFRIELGEIEAVLGAHPAVAAAVVMARQDGVGEQARLVGYVVAERGESVAVEALRRHLTERLPDYMVPAAFVSLPTLPQTPSGKVDRRALPAPDTARPDLEAAFAAPRTAAQKTLAEIWARVLGVERVGLDDNYFALGGDSILSIQLLSQAREKGIELSLQHLFATPTIRGLTAPATGTATAAEALAPVLPFALVEPIDRDQLPAAVEDAYPLAYLQAGMLYHSEESPESAIYHDIFAYDVRTAFDGAAFAAATDALAARHPVLRTGFDLHHYSAPLQLVYRQVTVPLRVVDLRTLSAAAQRRAIERFMAAERSRPFDWHRPPLLRFHLHRLEDDVFRLTASFHHAILDGWSLAAMLTDLLGLYLAAQGRHATSPPPAATFADYVALEQQALSAPESRDYWRQALAGAALSALPRRDPGSGSSGGVSRHRVVVPPAVSRGLGVVAEAAGVAIKSVLLVAHLRTLAALSGRRDVVTGVVSNGRPEREGGERALGLFLNTLPLRLDVGAGSWSQLARRAFEIEAEQLPFRRFPLAEIQRLAAQAPLFEVAFNFTHFHVYETAGQYREIEFLGGEAFEETNFTLLANFALALGSKEVELSLSYDTAALSAAQIAHIGTLYRRALTALARDPQAAAAVSLLSAAQRHQLLVAWNDTRAATPEPEGVHRLVERQARRTPRATAVAYEGERLSYRTLNRRANHLARRLRRLGVEPDGIVGLALDRGLDLAVALLGILKAGAAYLPLDPAYPAERLQFMVDDAGVELILTREALDADLPAGARTLGVDGLVWEGEDGAAADEADEDLTSGPAAANLAYVLYTSGSTGRPKGVAMSHGALFNLVHWQGASSAALAAAPTTLQFASVSFDVSFQELFATWSCGGTLVMLPETVRQDAEATLQLLAAEAVERIFVPFAALRQLAEALAAAADPPVLRLREVITAGEQLRIDDVVRRAWQALPGCHLHNQYGPTEAHVVTAQPLVGAPTTWAELPPIGRPIDNLRIYLADASLRPVAAEVPGELLIGGAGLARGYLGRPARTAERFVPDPWSNMPGSRLYRSGDLARHLPTGEIVYLGRVDHQVKVRGVRVELGEVEAALVAAEGVSEAAVLADGAAGARRLVAYVVPAPAAEIDPVALREALRASLPEAMVPAAFVTVASLPLTPSGKVDRRALAASGGRELRANRVYAPPRTDTERRVAEIWQQVLGVERVGRDDDFFDLGGHSLLSLRLIMRLRETFAVELPLRALFEASSVESLAVLIAQKEAERVDAATVEALLAEAEGLSDEELEALLAGPAEQGASRS